MLKVWSYETTIWIWWLLFSLTLQLRRRNRPSASRLPRPVFWPFSENSSWKITADRDGSETICVWHPSTPPLNLVPRWHEFSEEHFTFSLKIHRTNTLLSYRKTLCAFRTRNPPKSADPNRLKNAPKPVENFHERCQGRIFWFSEIFSRLNRLPPPLNSTQANAVNILLALLGWAALLRTGSVTKN